MSQPEDRIVGDISSSEFDHILVEYPRLTLKHNELVILEAHLSPLDVIFLCENGVEKLAIDYVKRHYEMNFPEEEEKAKEPQHENSVSFDDHGPSISEAAY